MKQNILYAAFFIVFYTPLALAASELETYCNRTDLTLDQQHTLNALMVDAQVAGPIDALSCHELGERAGQKLAVVLNGVKDLSPLAAIPTLIGLTIEKSDDVDLKTVACLPRLRNLNIDETHLKASLRDLKPLKTLGQLSFKRSTADWKNIGELTPITDLILLGIPQITSIDFIAPLKNLRRIWFASTAITSLAVLGENDFPKLTQVMIGDQGAMVNVSGIQRLPKLEELSLYTLVTPESADEVRNATNLRSLILSDAQFADLTFVGNMPKLERLYVPIETTDLTPVSQLAQLEELCISETKVRDISPLAELRNLELVMAMGAPVSDLAPIKPLQAEHLNSHGQTIALEWANDGMCLH